jgi:hypothetical protein
VQMTPTRRHSGRGAILASMGALASAVAASSCCFPLLPFVAAAGFAGSSALFATLRPYLLAVSVLLIGFGFYQAHRASRCNSRPSKLSTAVLWFSAVVITVTILFPQALAALLAG